MIQSRTSFVSTLFLFLFCFNSISAQIGGPIEKLSSYKTLEDFKFLDSTLNEVRVVAIGEATHGTREFNRIYLKLFKYLVAKHNINTLYLEDEFSTCLKLDEFVKNESSKTIDITEHFNYWPWQTKEMEDLILWIKAYNLKNPEHLLSVVGVDMQKGEEICIALNELLELSNLDTISIPQRPKADTEKEEETYLRSFHSAIQKDLQNKIEKLNGKDQLLANQLIDKLKQNETMANNLKKYFFRDYCMGENLLTHLNSSKINKGMFIAHNGHILKYYSKKKNETNPLKVSCRAGGVLEHALGDGFYSIMQDFDAGCFNAYHLLEGMDKSSDSISSYKLGPVCIEESIDKTLGEGLRHINSPICFINGSLFKKSKSNPYYKSNKRYMRYHAIGAVFMPQRKNKNQSKQFYYLNANQFDGLLFHKVSSPTTLK